MPVRIRLLGRLGIEGDNGVRLGASDLPGRQGRLALAYLTITRYPVERDTLAQLIWGDELPRSYERDLSAVISKLKAVLARVGGEGMLEGSAGSYELRLPAGSSTDVEDTRNYLEQARVELRAGRYEAALGSAYASFELARRPFLPGDDGDWIDERRADLRAIYRDAVDVTWEGYRALGNMPEALRFAERGVQIEPYREAAYVALMRLHMEQGNRAEALRVYERCRQKLLDDLGVPPGPEADAAHQDALRADIAPDAPKLAPPLVVAGRGPLVGRESELARLRAAWARTEAGEAGAALLGGDPGIGKTRLLAELAREVHASGGQVLFGRCDPEPLASFQPFVEALRRWVACAAPVALRAHGAPVSADLAAILPELQGRLGRTLVERTGARDRLRLYEAVAGLLAGIARDAPVLVAIDDLHAADLPTLGMLEHLLRAGEQVPLLVVATYRNAEPHPDPAVKALVGELRLDRLADEIAVRGLDAAAVGALVEYEAGHVVDAEEAERIRARTDGNPLFVGQLSRAEPEAALPPEVGDAIARHLRRLPADALAPLTPAAVIGQEFDVELLEAVSGVTGDALVDALETSVRARVLAHLPGTRRYAFTHPLVRDSLYDGLSEERRVRLHATVAEQLENLAPGDPAPLAHHWHAAGRPEPTARYSELAAEQAIAQLAFEDAVVFIDRAMAATTDPQARRRLLTRRAVAFHGDMMHALHPEVRAVESGQRSP